MTVTVVTPWHNLPELWPDYEKAIDAASPDELLIVDNGSTPRLKFAQIRFGTNRGFTRACNAGLWAATSDVVLFLNNDVEMIRDDWLERLAFQVRPGVLVGAQLRSDPHAAVDGERFPYLDGWCVAGMRDDLLKIGGFDETLEEPAYYSDNLLSLEARAAGMTLLEVTGGLRHKLNQTAKTDPNVRAATLANQAVYQARVRELTVAV
jgi:GT2 family glycosyltransferase